MRPRGTLPFYIGGFLGPFGGGVVAVLLPQLRDAFDATTAGVALSIPAYLVPFAALQLVSGTLGERLGRRRVVRTGYILYAFLSVLAAFVPTLGAFLAVRALQGCANAFLTPLLLAGLADEVPPRQIGRAVGTFAAVQTSAVALAPLVGGALGAVDWRLAFISQAVVAGGLALIPPADGEARDDRPGLRMVLTRRVGLLSAASFTGYAGITGIGFLVAVLAADDFGLGSVTRGVLLAGFGVAGIVTGRTAGNWVDRYGRVPVACVGIAVCAVLVAALGVAPTPVALGALWFATGLGSTLVWAGINTLAVEAVPGNRAGGTSVISAFRFAGNAAAPLLWLPLYHADPRLGFIGAGVLAAATAAFILPPARAKVGSVPLASIGDSFSSFFNAVGDFFSNLAAVSWPALFLALVFFMVYLTLRARASFHILRAAYPDSDIEFKRIWGAYFAGYGFNAVIPARGGDVVRLFLTKSSVPNSSYPAVGAAFSVEFIFDLTIAVPVLAYAFSQGVFPKPPDFSSLPAFDLAFLASHPRFTLFLLTVLGIAVLAGFALLSARVRAFWARVRQGLTILSDRRRYFREVWLVQFAGWLCRFTAFWFLLEAFNVGGSVSNVLLVLGVNAVAALVPFTPGGAGVQQALLVKVFGSGATVAAYSVGQQIAIAALTFGVGLASVIWIFKFRSFKEVIAAGREQREADKADKAEKAAAEPA